VEPTNSEHRAVVAALVRDVESTIGVANVAELTEYLASEMDRLIRQWNEAQFPDDANCLEHVRQQLVDDYQQRLHDEFVDVSWPRCPRHPNHPMWLNDGQWCCTRDDVVIAPLGSLPMQSRA
jgi:hypothetical protein